MSPSSTMAAPARFYQPKSNELADCDRRSAHHAATRPPRSEQSAWRWHTMNCSIIHTRAGTSRPVTRKQPPNRHLRRVTIAEHKCSADNRCPAHCERSTTGRRRRHLEAAVGKHIHPPTHHTKAHDTQHYSARTRSKIHS